VGTGAGISGVSYNFVATRAHCRVELYFGRPDGEENRMLFDGMRPHRDEIEALFGGTLDWQPLEEKQACRITSAIDADIYNPEQWPRMTAFLVEAMLRLEAATRQVLHRVFEEQCKRGR
jgi:hypothetical protein